MVRPSPARHATNVASTANLIVTALELDREADHQLALGHLRIAERLSRQAEEIREAAR